MLKSFLVLLLILSLSGCEARVNETQIKNAEEACKDSGGLSSFRTLTTCGRTCSTAFRIQCRDGRDILMWPVLGEESSNE